MQLETTRTARDLLAFELFSCRQSKELKRAYWKHFFISFIAGGIFIGYRFGLVLLLNPPLLKFAALSAFTVCLLLNHFFQRLPLWWKLRAYFWAAITQKTQHRHVIEISDAGLALLNANEADTTVYAWADIPAIHQTKRHVFVELPSTNYAIIPKRDFASAEEQLAFLQQALYHWQQARASEQKATAFIHTESEAALWIKRLADGAAFGLAVVLVLLIYFFPEERNELIAHFRQRMTAPNVPAKTPSKPAKKAIEDYEREIAEKYCAHPNDLEAIEELADIKSGQQRWLEARDLHYESHLRFGTKAYALQRLGRNALQRQAFVEAEQWIRLELAQKSSNDPTSFIPIVELSKALRGQGRLAEARELLQQSLANDRDGMLAVTFGAELFALRKQEQVGWLADFTKSQNKNLLAHERQRLLDGMPLPALPSVKDKKQQGYYVLDFADALPVHNEREIADWLAKYSQQGDGQIYLAIIETLPKNMSPAAYVQKYLSYFRGKDYDDRVLLLVILGQQQLWIETSPLTRAAITDSEARQICQQIMLPYFQRQAYVPGIKAGLQQIARELHGQLPPKWQQNWKRKFERAGGKSFTWLVYLVSILVAGLVLIIGHESAHALVGKGVGLRVYRVIIGHGAELFTFKLGSLKIEFKQFPFGGCTYVGTPLGYQSRLGIWLMVAAGPFFHLLVLALFHLVYATTNIREFLHAHAYLNSFSNALYFYNWFHLVINSWPTTKDTSEKTIKSDGYKLWHIPFYTEKDFADYRTAGLVFEWLDKKEDRNFNQAFAIVKQARQEFPDSVLFELAHGSTLLDVGEYEKGRNLAHNALQRVEENDLDLKRWAWNELAYIAALLNRVELMAEADEYSQLALKDCLDETGAIIGTRGSVLLRLQRVNEGMALLHRSIGMAQSRYGKAENTCWIAIGYAMQNDFEQARECLTKVRKSKTIPYFFKQAEQEVAERYQAFTQQTSNPAANETALAA